MANKKQLTCHSKSKVRGFVSSVREKRGSNEEFVLSLDKYIKELKNIAKEIKSKK